MLGSRSTMAAAFAVMTTVVTGCGAEGDDPAGATEIRLDLGEAWADDVEAETYIEQLQGRVAGIGITGATVERTEEGFLVTLDVPADLSEEEVAGRLSQPAALQVHGILVLGDRNVLGEGIALGLDPIDSAVVVGDEVTLRFSAEDRPFVDRLVAACGAREPGCAAGALDLTLDGIPYATVPIAEGTQSLPSGELVVPIERDLGEEKFAPMLEHGPAYGLTIDSIAPSS